MGSINGESRQAGTQMSQFGVNAITGVKFKICLIDGAKEPTEQKHV